MSIVISQSVAILVDGNNIERSLHELCGDFGAMLNFDTFIPRLLGNRGLNRLVYFREGKSISSKLAERLHESYHGSVRPCHKNADIPLSIKATQLSRKVDTIIIMSGDSDYIELVRHLKTEGVRVEIAAIEKTTSQVLREEADYFHPIIEDDWFIYRGASRVKGTKKVVNKKTSSNYDKKFDQKNNEKRNPQNTQANKDKKNEV